MIRALLAEIGSCGRGVSDECAVPTFSLPARGTPTFLRGNAYLEISALFSARRIIWRNKRHPRRHGISLAYDGRCPKHWARHLLALSLLLSGQNSRVTLPAAMYQGPSKRFGLAVLIGLRALPHFHRAGVGRSAQTTALTTG